jgi:hypothetical protein
MDAEPHGRLGRAEHGGPKEHGRDEAEREHRAPVPGTGEREPDRVGDEDPERDHQLEERDEPSADPRRGDFGEVQRRGRGYRADADADERSRDQERAVPARRRGEQGGGGEQQRDQDQGAPASHGVREPAADEAAGHRAEQHGADERALLERVQPEVLADEQQRSRDDAEVVTEQQAAEACRDRP